ncbi:histidine utilization repressor [Rhizocola hellebori]|uniref:Histidine utilization repressor n=1 Tax=Rhizocola hellebori TaxID=1392758 RepID=A0A8J3QG10_9ACTN|nr:GntR family transcriptional regulator [Rhizocola hellebori]GIH10319.1 histidine utilization repressor [Rhizocola hellebori]
MATIETPKSQYGQIADLLISRIQDGTYPPGSSLPSEDKLADALKVSRVTINRAVGLLRLSGYVKVKRGSGTIVRTLPVILRDAKARYAARMQGTGAGEVEARQHNLVSNTVYRQIAEVPAPEHVAQTLDLKPGDPTLLRSRTLFANNEPTQIADSYIPAAIAKLSPELRNENAGPGGSYGRLSDIGHGPARFTEDVTVRMPTEQEQQILELEAAQPVFQIWHVAFDAKNKPVEVAKHVMPGHLWQLHYGWDE